MSALISAVLAAMFSVLTFRGNFFKNPDYLVAATFGAVTTPVFLSGIFAEGSWIVSASGGYVGGLIGCFIYSRVKGYTA